MVGTIGVVKVSVIIPTRDRANLLSDCLHSLTHQTLPIDVFEVIVVDNGSRDETRSIVERHRADLQLSYRSELEPGLHVGRHAGTRLARSDLLVFCDDDIVAERTWLSSVVDAFADQSVSLVGGNNRPLFEKAPPDWLQAWWERPAGHGKALGYLSILDFGEGQFDIDPGFVWGCNFSIRRRVLDSAGGFHPDAMPPDRLRWRGDGETHVSEWVRRSRQRALFHSGASVGHRVPVERMNADYFVRRAYAQGVSDSFADLRRCRGNVTGSYQKLVRRGRRALGRAASTVTGPRGPAGQRMREVQRAVQAAWSEGYDFHQAEALKDPTLMAWVLRENYY